MRGGLSVILVVCQSVCERGGAGTDALLVFLPSIKWLNAALYDTLQSSLRSDVTIRMYPAWNLPLRLLGGERPKLLRKYIV